jgi:hypothetical protein
VFIVRVVMKHINTLRGQNAEFFNATAGGTCRIPTTGLSTASYVKQHRLFHEGNRSRDDSCQNLSCWVCLILQQHKR